MNNINELPVLSVFEAICMLNGNYSNTYPAVQSICNQCNIPINNSTKGRFTRKFTHILKQRRIAIKAGNLDAWLSCAKNQEFCKYLPVNASVRCVPDSDEYVADSSSPVKRGRYTKQPLTTALLQALCHL